MEKKYIENFKKNIDIAALATLTAIWSAFIGKILFFNFFQYMVPSTWVYVYELVTFISTFSAYKKTRKNAEEVEILEDLYDIKNDIDESVDMSKKFIKFMTTPKQETKENAAVESSEVKLDKQQRTPLQIFYTTAIKAFAAIAVVYLIAMLICWSVPCAGAMGALIIIPICIGLIDAYY